MFMRTVLAAAAACAALAGCSSASGNSASTSGYWTEHRLLAAQEWRPHDWQAPSPGATPSPRQNVRTLRVGALFYGNSSGEHFCTASVVDSPGQNLIVTAAHCLNDGEGGGDKGNVVFVPAYADGQAPYGEWQPSRYVIDPRWTSGADPEFDVAFVVLKPLDGKNIQQVLSGNTIAFNSGYENKVRVTGYPASSDAPIACDNTTTRQDPDYLKFPCADFYGGTSGSPFVTGYNEQTGTGTLVGVLGGYEEGGSTPDVSYSDSLGDDIKKLYNEAIASQRS